MHTTSLTLIAGVLIVVAAAEQGSGAPVDDARAILEATGVQGGLVVHLGCGDGKLTAALRASDAYLVHGLDADTANVARARANIQAAGLYGNVSVDHLAGVRLPYVDNLVNLLIAEDPAGVPMEEITRVLCPGGVAVTLDSRLLTLDSFRKPRPKAMDEWTHFLHGPGNNAVSQDTIVGPLRHMQWIGSPRWARHHDHMGSISALVATAGRIFYIMDEGSRMSIELPAKWSLFARDAFNGTILWKRPIARWHTHLWPLKSGPAHLPRRLVAVGDTVYVTLGIDAPVSVLDAATGKTLRVLKGTEGTEELVVSDGIVFAVVNGATAKRYQPEAPYQTIGEIKRAAGTRIWDDQDTSVVAVDAPSGKVLWCKSTLVAPTTLAVDVNRAYLHDGEKVVCLDRTDGRELWTSKPIPRWEKILSFFSPTLVVYKDVVLMAGGEKMIPHRGGKDTVTALAAESGEVLWTADHGPCGYQSAEDLLVAGGLVWSGATSSGSYSGVFTGRDPWTGEVKSEFAPDVETYWFHHRCYRAKATEEYLLTSRTGIEFLDIDKKSWEIHHWTRGGCLYGIMPANGLIYNPPHDCACYPEAKTFGLNALAPRRDEGLGARGEGASPRLNRGPAYGAESGRLAPRDAASSRGARWLRDDWPTYRHDSARSGRTITKVPSDLKPVWQATLGGRLSSPVMADGKLFVAAVDQHAVKALDADSGEHLWTYTAGGRVDSPPTICSFVVPPSGGESGTANAKPPEGGTTNNVCVFGSADGWVYCLRADDGELIWRYRAAPRDRRLTAFEQVESVWPVPGSVLVRDGTVYCAAGRSVFLDGGIVFLRLDLKTGRRLSQTVLDDRDPETGENLQTRLQVLNMPVGLNDVLSCDGRHVYMRSQVFDLEGNRGELGPHSGIPAGQGSVQRGETAHLFAPNGFLDGDWFHRAYWVYGRSFAGGHSGYHQAGKYAPSGRILVFDDEKVYGYGRLPQYYRWTTPLEYQLFAADKEAPVVEAAASRGSLIRVENSKSLDPTGTPLAVEAWVHTDGTEGVVLARGGPLNGYALIVKKGRPQFLVRSKEALVSVGAERKIVGKWVHLAGVLNADGQLQLYVDGQLAGSAQGALIAAEPKQAMEIGADDKGSVGEYKSPNGLVGLIDEVRIYHGVVSPAEIQEHFATPGASEAKDARLVLAMSLDEKTAKDESGSGNDGKMENARLADGKVGSAARFNGWSPRGGRSFVKHDWTQQVPLLARAMVQADRTLFIAGPPDVVDEEQVVSGYGSPEIQAKLAEQDAALEGERGAILWAVSADDGSKLAECSLESLPVFDGMIAAAGRLYVATTDGKVVCLGGR